MATLAEVALLVAGALVLAGLAVRFGILIAGRLDRLVDRDEEDPRGPVG